MMNFVSCQVQFLMLYYDRLDGQLTRIWLARWTFEDKSLSGWAVFTNQYKGLPY